MKELTEQEIDALIARAGLSDVMTVHRSAILFDAYAYGTEGRGYDDYRALAALLRAYGAQERERERERIVQRLAEFVPMEASSDWGEGYRTALADVIVGLRAMVNE